MRRKGKTTGARAHRLGQCLEIDEVEAAHMSKDEIARALTEEGVDVRLLVSRFAEAMLKASMRLNCGDSPGVSRANGAKAVGRAANLTFVVAAHDFVQGRGDSHSFHSARMYSAKSSEEAEDMYSDGMQAYKDNHMESAIEYWREAKKRFLFLGMSREMAACERNIAYALERIGDSSGAKAQFERARDIYQKIGCKEEAHKCELSSLKLDRP